MVPEHMVVADEPEYFSYRLPNGTIVGWQANTEIWWRNRKPDDVIEGLKELVDAEKKAL